MQRITNNVTLKKCPLSFYDNVNKITIQTDQHNIVIVSWLIYNTLLTMMMSRLQLVTLFQKWLNIVGTNMCTAPITGKQIITLWE